MTGRTRWGQQQLGHPWQVVWGLCVWICVCICVCVCVRAPLLCPHRGLSPRCRFPVCGCVTVGRGAPRCIFPISCSIFSPATAFTYHNLVPRTRAHMLCLPCPLYTRSPLCRCHSCGNAEPAPTRPGRVYRAR